LSVGNKVFMDFADKWVRARGLLLNQSGDTSKEKRKVYSDDPLEDAKKRYEIFHKKFEEAFKEMGWAPAISIINFTFDLLDWVIGTLERDAQSISKLKKKHPSLSYIDFFGTAEFMRKELKKFWKRLRKLT